MSETYALSFSVVMQREKGEGMSLYQLVYYSTPTKDVDIEIVLGLWKRAAAKNKKLGITGFLCFSPNHFMQALEGEAKHVGDLYATIAADSRHHTLRLLYVDELKERVFSHWHMGYIGDVEIHKHILLRYGPHDCFEPPLYVGRRSIALLRELAQARKEHSQ